MTPASTLKINKNLFSMSLLLDNKTNSANDVRVNGEKNQFLLRNLGGGYLKAEYKFIQ